MASVNAAFDGDKFRDSETGSRVERAVELTKRVKAATLEPRRRARPHAQNVNKKRGAAVKWSRVHANALWHTVRALKGQEVNGKRASACQIARAQHVLDALCAMHRKEVANTAQYACAVAFTHSSEGDGLRALTGFSETSVRWYLNFLAAAGIVLYQPGECGQLSLVGFPALYESHELARKWCAAKLMRSMSAPAKRGDLDSWWRPMLMALVDGGAGAAELLQKYRAAYANLRAKKAEDLHNIIAPRKAAKRRAAMEAAAPRHNPRPMLAPELVEALTNNPDAAMAALRVHRETRRALQEHARTNAAAPRQPASAYPQLLGDNSAWGFVNKSSASGKAARTDTDETAPPPRAPPRHPARPPSTGLVPSDDTRAAMRLVREGVGRPAECARAPELEAVHQDQEPEAASGWATVFASIQKTVHGKQLRASPSKATKAPPSDFVSDRPFSTSTLQNQRGSPNGASFPGVGGPAAAFTASTHAKRGRPFRWGESDDDDAG